MQIAIIGAGNVGRALATSLTRAGHTSPSPRPIASTRSEAATETGATAVATSSEAVSKADVIVLAVPATALDTVASEIGSSLTARSSSTSRTDRRRAPTVAATSIAEELQSKLPEAKVVKAFNTAFASRQADPTVGGIAPDGYVAGDDDSAKQIVLDVVESVGFRPVDVGSLVAARTLEGMAWLNIQRNLAGGTWQDAWVLVGPETIAAVNADSRN